MTLEDYVQSAHVENNWMVRFLTGTMSGVVNESHLSQAKEILRSRVVIGLLEEKETSMQRFEYYFGWSYKKDPKKQKECRRKILVGDFRSNEMAKTKIKENSQAWTMLMWQNKLDMKLYKFAQHLFLVQGAELFSDMQVAPSVL
eukprot:CAMPEP_0118689224 /NCGR_PEP_ID=MMETSP0800-20121206/9367_1 /TAXON_ID=210618 ORGANISM="Striatella unipunctata, Strain CCMP2910" /NCGR_SAMPLE_ID=MMETSP0800 /ASSEMBLY_ACC=CAM_ASM_000638 /LENGTH=143 /DNA_ID=CAMNT_0006586591 /DNA_START=217 /DNA_END=648 /DNA_ORIENTATION=-